MCGIVGVVAKYRTGLHGSQADVMEELLYADGLRGLDATGAFSVSYKNHVRIVKQATNPGIFLSTASWRNFKAGLTHDVRFVIGHNRKATFGEKTTKNAHPFTDGKIVLVHNGFIANHKELGGEVAVDSQAIVKVLSEEADVVKGLDKLMGAFAIVWYNHITKKLYLARNPERTLAVAMCAQHMLIASEKGLLEWILGRNKIRYDSIEDVPDNQVWTVHFDSFKLDKGAIASTKLSRIPVACEITFDPEFATGGEVIEGDAATEGARTAGEYPPMTELHRAQQQAAEREMQNNSVNELIYEMRRLYPSDTKALFWPTTVTPGTNHVKVEGMVWKPGKKAFKAVYHVANEADKELYLNPKLPLVATIACPARKNSDHMIMLKNLEASHGALEDAQNFSMSAEEWHAVATGCRCHECDGEINPLRPELALVVKNQYEYEVTCDKCFLKPINRAGANGG